MAKEYKAMSIGPSTTATKVLLERANAALPFSQATAILDNGCGPGPIISKIITTYGAEIPETVPFLAADFSVAMVAQVDASKKEGVEAGNKVWQRVETKVLNAMDMQGVPDSSHSHITAGWVYFMTPDPQKCLSESLRILQPGGVLALSSWEGNQWMDIMKVIGDVRPDKVLPELPKAWSNVDLLKAELETAGFKDVTSERVAVTMQFENRDSFVDMLVTKMPHMVAMTKDMSAEDVQRLRELSIAKCEEMSSEEPGELHGTVLIAVGKK